MKFDKPISKKMQQLHRKVGYYLNQNHIIRLYEISKHYKIAGKNINYEIRGTEDIEILWELRCKFDHGLGKYDFNIKKDQALLDKLISRYKEDHIIPDEYPISQDKTIKGIIHGIKSYLNEETKRIKLFIILKMLVAVPIVP